MKWKERPLRDLLAEPVRNGLYKPKEFRGHGIPIVKMGELFADDVLVKQTADRLELSAREKEVALLSVGDLLFARRSYVLEGSGKSSIVLRLDEPTTFESSVIRARPNTELAEPQFLHYFFLSTLGRERVMAIASRTAVSGIRGSDLPGISVPCPPRPVQTKVAAALAAYDELIENNQRRIEILKEMAGSIYRELCVKPRPDELGKDAQWQDQPFDDAAHFVNGFAFKPSVHWQDVGKPIIKIKELKNGITHDTPRYHGDDVPKKKHIDDGALLFSWSADLDTYIWDEGPALLNQHIFEVIPKSDLDRLFLFHALQEAMPHFRARALGATMHHIKRSALSEVRLTVPPPDIHKRFVEQVRPIHEMKRVLKKENAILRRARDLLLPKLISGEIDVSELDIDTSWLAA